MKNSIAADPLLITEIRVASAKVHVWFNNGQEVVNPLKLYPTLAKASHKAQQAFRLMGDGEGVHWTELDLHLSADGLLHGYPEQFPAPPPLRKSRSPRFIRVFHSSPYWFVVANLTYKNTTMHKSKNAALSEAKDCARLAGIVNVEIEESVKPVRKFLSVDSSRKRLSI